MTARGNDEAVTVRTIRNRKGGPPLVCLTAYGANIARLLDPHVDLLLVGDSLGFVLYSQDTTLGVTLEQMIVHGAAVRRGVRRACVIVDLPFGTYQESPQQAFRNAARVMAETGCGGVKVEGGREMAETIAFLTTRGIPVLGHVGLMPQLVNTLGGFRTQGEDEAGAAAILADAQAVAEAGAFAAVVEGIPEALAQQITAGIPIPTIGIGASSACDGQILVTDEMLGLAGDWASGFAKRYAELGNAVQDAAARYAAEVRERRFPAAQEETQ